MLFLKEANFDDVEKQYDFISKIPLEESGFTNPHYNCTKSDFINIILPGYINISKGINLPTGWCASTEFFLWNNDQIVGLFRLRHYLNDFLKNGPGHIGYFIKKEFRKKGYATEGLRLLIIRAWDIIGEDEIYMSVLKENKNSLNVQLKNGAYIHHENDAEYFTRIKK